MNKDPFEILGVYPSATDEEIKNAYRALARKYHPDNFGDDDSMKQTAAEKMKEINWAYDEIQRMREAGKSGANNNNGSYYGASQAGGAGNPGYNSDRDRPEYIAVRNDINAHKFTDAERKLLSMDAGNRSAEWHYLMSLILFSRKKQMDAMRELEIACNMDPYNNEYQQAKQMFNVNSNTYGNTYYNTQQGNYDRRAYERQQRQSDACDCCANLICLDCLCECMGGDLITCC